jgi:hypothetical protein
MSSSSHSFDIDLATEHSIEEAIVIHHFQHWIRVNRVLGQHFIDGRTWSYQTHDYIAAHFPYLNGRQVKYIIQKLVTKKILLSKVLSDDPMKRTNWYAFVDENKFLKKSKEIETISKKSYDQTILSNGPDKIVPCLYSTDAKHTYHNKEINACAREEKIRKGEFVFLTQKESEELTREFGDVLVGEKISAMDVHCRNNRPKGYKDCYGELRLWCIKQKKQDSQQKHVPSYSKKSEEVKKEISTNEDKEIFYKDRSINFLNRLKENNPELKEKIIVEDNMAIMQTSLGEKKSKIDNIYFIEYVKANATQWFGKETKT